MIRPLRLLVLFLLIALPTKVDSLAQPLGEGTLTVTNWPATAPEDADLEVLPFLDTLTLEYTYEIEAARPAMSFVVAWTPGNEGVLDGEVVSIDQLPEGVRMIALDVRADVVSGGQVVTDLLISADSLALDPAPYVFPFDAAPLDWATLFADLDADAARKVFADGFTLENPEIVRIAFAVFEDEPTDRRDVEVRPRPRPPARTTIFVPNADIWILIGRDPYRLPPRVTRGPVRPRGDEIGRGTLGTTGGRTKARDRSRGRAQGDTTDGDTDDDRGGNRSGEEKVADGGDENRQKGRLPRIPRKKDDDDDDDDDRQLLPAALAGVAALGVVAFAGGTVGYFGHAEAPIGLMSGFVQPGWGMLLHVAVNDAVLRGEGGERLNAGLLAFGGAGVGPLQPALGLGVWADEFGDNIDLTPALSLGAVVYLRPMLLHLGYDVLEGGVQFGLAVNFRGLAR